MINKGGRPNKLTGSTKTRIAVKQACRKGLQCPVCGSLLSMVIDKRNHTDGLGIRRRRMCENGHRFSTKEFYDGSQIPYIPNYQI